MSTRLRNALVASVLGPLAIALVMTPWRDNMANAAAALVLVAAVVAVASFGERAAGIVATVSAAVWFDFFLTRPYEQFAIASAHDIETTLALAAVGLAVTEIAVRSRRMFSIAMSEGDYLAALRDLSDLVATGAGTGEVIAQAVETLTDVLHLSACRFEHEPAGPATGEPRRPRLERNGEVGTGERQYDVGADGLPPGEVELPVSVRGRPAGRFVLEGTPGNRLSIEQRTCALALADQVGAALADHRELA